MKKTPFTLDAWLKDKSLRVVDKDGNEAKIESEPVYLDKDGHVFCAYKIATPGHRFSVIGAGQLADYFIEVQEPEISEDERVRRTLVEYFGPKAQLDFVRGIPIQKIRDWLEKQKELFESGTGLYYYDGEKTIYCGYPATEENPYDFAMNQQEKQADASRVEKAMREVEEKAKAFTEAHKGESAEEILAQMRGEELSEEDKTNGWTGGDLRRYLSCLRRMGTGNPQQPETINSKWFKEHCRYQPQWKPTEEQMEMLAMFANLRCVSKREAAALESLYEQLKKLM